MCNFRRRLWSVRVAQYIHTSPVCVCVCVSTLTPTHSQCYRKALQSKCIIMQRKRTALAPESEQAILQSESTVVEFSVKWMEIWIWIRVLPFLPRQLFFFFFFKRHCSTADLVLLSSYHCILSLLDAWRNAPSREKLWAESKHLCRCSLIISFHLEVNSLSKLYTTTQWTLKCHHKLRILN